MTAARKAKRFPSEVDRADAIHSLACAIAVLHENETYPAPRDLIMLVEHRLRSYLREGECPLCPNCQLEVLLTQTEVVPTAPPPTRGG